MLAETENEQTMAASERTGTETRRASGHCGQSEHARLEEGVAIVIVTEWICLIAGSLGSMRLTGQERLSVEVAGESCCSKRKEQQMMDRQRQDQDRERERGRLGRLQIQDLKMRRAGCKSETPNHSQSLTNTMADM